MVGLAQVRSPKNAPNLLLIGAAALLAFVGCSANIENDGKRLEADLRERYPREITSVVFAYNPPLDPAVLFIDVSLTLDQDDHAAFICDEVVPLVMAKSKGIGVFTNYGFTEDQCE